MVPKSSKAGPVNSFFAVFYLLIHYLAAFLLFSSIQTLLSENTNLSEAIGSIVVFVILLIYWFLLEIISLIFLVFAKIWNQSKPVLILSLIAVVLNFILLIIPGIIQGIGNIDIEYLKGLAVLMIIFLLHMIAIISGFNNLKK